MKQFLALLFSLFLFLTVCSQTDSCRFRFSLLTCSPGQELYSLFGHSALRLTDSAKGIDIIFNYGTFNFDDPDFYPKFGRGNMQYYVSVESMNDFVEQYRYEKRSITEQLLNLSCAEKEKLSEFLKNNTKEENKYYLYNFLFDNCSSRLKDIVAKNSNAPLSFQTVLPTTHTTFRHLIHEYLDKGRQPWTKLGLDLLLGSALDVRATNEQSFFLPEYLMKGFDQGKSGEKNLVAAKQQVLSVSSPVQNSGLPSPLVFFSILLVLVAIAGFVKNKWVTALLNGFDFLLFFAAGLTGLLLLALWLARTDTVCRNNFNLLWALPTHIIMAFLIFSKKYRAKKYWLITSLIAVLLLLTWFFLPQQLNIALLPLVGIILLRSFMQFKKA